MAAGVTRVRVQIPYVEERRATTLEATLTGYYAQEGVDVDLVTLTGFSWGQAHNVMLAAEFPDADYVLLGCDDVVPHPGALAAAVRFHVETGDLPGCRFLQDGDPLDPSYDAKPHGEDTNWSRFFLAPPAVYAQVGPLLDLSWFVDVDYSQRMNEAGHRLRMCDGFVFDHLDPPRLWATPDEVARQRAVYHAACDAAGRSRLM